MRQAGGRASSIGTAMAIMVLSIVGLLGAARHGVHSLQGQPIGPDSVGAPAFSSGSGGVPAKPRRRHAAGAFAGRAMVGCKSIRRGATAMASQAEHQLAVETALRLFWRGRDGFNVAYEEELAMEQAMDPLLQELGATGLSTYGEVEPSGVRQLGRAMGLTGGSGTGSPAVFMDMGSGVGKFVVQAYLEWPRVVQSVGVELSKTRAARASDAWEAMMLEGDAQDLRLAALDVSTLGAAAKRTAPSGLADGVRLHQGDMLEQDISNVTHLYLASLCFSDSLMVRLAAKISTEGVNVLCVATLLPFPSELRGFEVSGTLRANMSWTRERGVGALVTIYTRSLLNTS